MSKTIVPASSPDWRLAVLTVDYIDNTFDLTWHPVVAFSIEHEAADLVTELFGSPVLPDTSPFQIKDEWGEIRLGALRSPHGEHFWDGEVYKTTGAWLQYARPHRLKFVGRVAPPIGVTITKAEVRELLEHGCVPDELRPAGVVYVPSSAAGTFDPKTFRPSGKVKAEKTLGSGRSAKDGVIAR